MPHARRNRGRSRGGAGLDTLSLRPRISAGDRGPRTDLQRLTGELIERPVPVARPVPPPARTGAGPVARLVVEHRYDQPVRSGPSGPVAAAVLALCLLCAVVFVVFALAIAGKLSGTAPPWKTDAIHQQQQQHHRAGGR